MRYSRKSLSTRNTFAMEWRKPPAVGGTLSGLSFCCLLERACRNCFPAPLPPSRRRKADWAKKEPSESQNRLIRSAMTPQKARSSGRRKNARMQIKASCVLRISEGVRTSLRTRKIGGDRSATRRRQDSPMSPRRVLRDRRPAKAACHLTRVSPLMRLRGQPGLRAAARQTRRGH